MKVTELIHRLEYLRSQNGETDVKIGSISHYVDVCKIADVIEHNGKIQILVTK